MKKPSVSILIPNYNGEKILAKTLTGVMEAVRRYGVEGSEVVLLDDASEDGSVDLVKMSFPEVAILSHKTNRGFSESVLSGTRSCRNEIVILLNSDVVPSRDFIAPLTRWFRHADTFSVSPLIYDPNGVPLRVSWNLAKIVRGVVKSQPWNLDEALKLAREGRQLKSLFASGGSMAFRKEMFLKLGGFLPIYKPFYGEDRDLGTRGWRFGWKTFFEPESVVIHDHQTTIGRFFSKKLIKMVRRRNRFFYLWIHLSPPALYLRHFPMLFFRLPWRFMRVDTTFAAALIKAMARWHEVMRLRALLNEEARFHSLEEVIDEINGI